MSKNKNEVTDYIKDTEDIPENLRKILPKHAQHIYLKSHNNALEEYKNPESRKYGGTREEAAHRVAWAAVKSKYYKDEISGKWKPKEGVEIPEED